MYNVGSYANHIMSVRLLSLSLSPSRLSHSMMVESMKDSYQMRQAKHNALIEELLTGPRLGEGLVLGGGGGSASNSRSNSITDDVGVTAPSAGIPRSSSGPLGSTASGGGTREITLDSYGPLGVMSGPSGVYGPISSGLSGEGKGRAYGEYSSFASVTQVMNSQHTVLCPDGCLSSNISRWKI